MKLEVINYTKKIKDRVVLDKINVSFESGKVYGLYGKNGSGKTMLFRAIATLILPNEGDIVVDGNSIINNKFDLSQIGVLIENAGFYMHHSGYENLEMLYTINHKKDKNHINNILKKVGLYEERNKKFKEYSLGMKQRLNIAQAFMENQRIIILDEPTNGIDEKGLEIIYDFIHTEKAKGKLILIASHDKEDLLKLCDVIYKMDKGRLEKVEGGLHL